MGEGEGVAGRPGEGTNLLKREVKLLGDVLLQHADQHQVHEVEAPPQLQAGIRGNQHRTANQHVEEGVRCLDPCG